MVPIADYCQELSSRWGAAWNRFWFTPADPYGLCVMRIFAGLLAGWYLLSLSSDLVIWLGPDGLLPIATVQEMTAESDGYWNGRASYFYAFDAPGPLWIAHILGLGVVLVFLVGWWTPVTSKLALVVVLAYVHRAPMIIGQFEPVLTMMLAYLCLAPCGRCLSVDSWLRHRRAAARSGSPLAPADREPSVAAGICQRRCT
jgi:hypothetical protein